jgi:hypothetical protein
MQRLRIDLDGVPLSDENGRVTAVFRYRTRDALILNLPESIDVRVPWSLLESADLDLRTGRLRLAFTEAALRELRWLSGHRILQGEWLDRGEIVHPPGYEGASYLAPQVR